MKRFFSSKLVLASIGVVIGAAFFASVHSDGAKAYSVNDVPSDILSGVKASCKQSGWTVVNAAWLASPSKPSSTTVDVQAGSKSVELALFALRYRCKSSPARESITKIARVDDKGASGLAGLEYRMSYPSGGNSGKVERKRVFTYSFGGTITSTATRTINIHGGAYVYYTNREQCGVVSAKDKTGTTKINGKTCDTESDKIKITFRVTPAWSIRGETYIRKNSEARKQSNITAGISDVVRWDHDLRNQGPSNMNRSVAVVVDRLDYDLQTGNQVGGRTDQHGNRQGNSNQLFYQTNNSYTIPASAVGKRLCQRIAWNPQSSSQSGWGRSTMRCVSVPYNYNLTPSITSPGGGDVVQRGGDVDVKGNINNSGSTQTRNDVQWRLTEVIFPGSANISSFNSVRTSTQDPCTYLTNERSCNDNVQRKTGDTIARGGVNARGDKSRTIPDDMETNDRICWMLSVRPYAHNSASGTWRHSAIVCNTVGKQPKVQIHGGDVRAGAIYSGGNSEVNADIITATTIMKKDGKRVIYGSWGEYGLFAKNSILSSSGAGLSSNDKGRNASNAKDYNMLTFANTPTYGNFSNDMGSIRDAQDYYSNNATALPNASVNVGNLGSGTYTRSGNVTLTGATIGKDGSKGRTVVLVVSGTVTISGDLKYPGGTYSSIGNLPQLIIIAQNIVVQKDVTQINAWLIAKNPSVSDSRTTGRLSTCGAEYNYSNSLAGNNCNKKLQMNGPVMAQNIYLRRTNGAEHDNPGTPAEVINLRPDAYLWGRGQAVEAGAIQTMHVRDKPPRL